jgi:hypothetical protein
MAVTTGPAPEMRMAGPVNIPQKRPPVAAIVTAVATELQVAVLCVT